jgi:hypothetical protein
VAPELQDALFHGLDAGEPEIGDGIVVELGVFK